MCLVNLENLRSEKEYYMKEYHRLLEQNKGAATSRSDSEIELLRKLSEKDQSIHSLQRELNQKMNEKDQLIMNLQKENKILAEEKFNLMSRLETARDRPDTDMEAMSLRVRHRVVLLCQILFTSYRIRSFVFHRITTR